MATAMGIPAHHSASEVARGGAHPLLVLEDSGGEEIFPGAVVAHHESGGDGLRRGATRALGTIP